MTKFLRVSPYSGGNMWTGVSTGSVNEKKFTGMNVFWETRE